MKNCQYINQKKKDLHFMQPSLLDISFYWHFYSVDSSNEDIKKSMMQLRLRRYKYSFVCLSNVFVVLGKCLKVVSTKKQANQNFISSQVIKLVFIQIFPTQHLLLKQHYKCTCSCLPIKRIVQIKHRVMTIFFTYVKIMQRWDFFHFIQVKKSTLWTKGWKIVKCTCTFNRETRVLR